MLSVDLMRRFSLRMLLLLSLVGGAAQAAPAINTLKRGLISDSNTGIAVNGYDVVAYFTQGKPVAGVEAHTYRWNDANWRFSSQGNLDLFKAEPTRYAPQYGGYCAYGVSQGYLVTIEPEQFTILDGKLYLNYSADVQKKWVQDIAGYNHKADAQFPALLKKK